MGWRRGATLGKGCSGVVSLALSEPQSKSNATAAAAAKFIDLPPLFAVKSAVITQYESLHKEKNLLFRFRDCPYIISCYGYDCTFEKGRLLYNLLLEYASGGSLFHRIRKSPRGLPECDVKRYTKMILLGLSHIHELGYVHCDLKPQNILITKQSSVNSCSCSPDVFIEEEIIKISDFGLAKRAAGGESSVKLCGTPLYLAPETVWKREYEPHSDIWALGCTVLQMITGKPAWNCNDKDYPVEDLLYRIRYTSLVPEIPLWISTVARDFLNKCMVRDPEKRWTANMLLRHPFVLSLSICDDNFAMIKEEEEIRNRPVAIVVDESLDDLPKPNLLMSAVKDESSNDFLKPNLLMLNYPKPNCGASVVLKRKRAVADYTEEDGRSSRNNHYWCNKRISIMSDLCDDTLMLTVKDESSDDLPKPNLLMLNYPNPNCGAPVVLKRKRAVADDAEEDIRSSRNNPYWCRTRNSVIYDLYDAVPLGF